MAKITNPKKLTDLQKLKLKADEQGIEYKKNATAIQMKELLNPVEDTGNIENTETTENIGKPKKPKSIKSEPKEQKVDVTALLEKINNLEKLVRKTGDHNKIKDFEDAQKGMEGFSFTLKLFPTDEGDYPIISWKTLKNYVARNNADKTVQKIEIVYVKDGENETQELDLVDFVRVLKRTDPILAKSMKNLDGSEVYVEEKISKEEDLPYYIIKPKGNTFNAIITYEGEDLTILSTYLNA